MGGQCKVESKKLTFAIGHKPCRREQKAEALGGQCQYCPPNKGCNANGKRKPKPDKHKNKRR